ncbi:MAG: transglutaminase domain-containing protein, partial [Sedimentisphaerales bacterium]|nr:transglutaminase domain-containing protein [Sedimentisphaerales bacterium]
AVNVGWVTSTILYRHADLLNYVPLWLWRTGVGMEGAMDTSAYIGFSTSGELSSVLLMKGDQDTTPVLKIVSETCPGYLRARAFDVYRQSRWIDVSAAQAVLPSQNMPFGASLPGRMNYFRLSNRHPANTREMTIRHELPVRDAIFTPLGTLAVEAPLPHLNYDDDSIVSPPYPRANLTYRLSYADRTYAPPPTRSMLNLPNQLDPRVEELADKVFAGRTATAEKITAVVDHFQTNHTYSLAVSIPPGEDKLEYFLLRRSGGYCEYFASGAAILLRLADVPTRYVTGFLVTEKDSSGDAWIARNMDAHAWVEAWDQENDQWLIVEATVQDGLAAPSANDASDRTGGLGRYLLLGQLVNDLYEYGLFGVLAWALEFYGLPAASFLLAATAGGILWWLYRRAKAARTPNAAGALAPEVIAMHKLLAYMDRRVGTAGLRRDGHETIQAFAHRLRASDRGQPLWGPIADWYLDYADLRYRRTIPTDELHRLRHLAACLHQPRS